MKRLDVYIESSIKGPRRRDGVVGYIIEYMTNIGEPATKTWFWTVEGMSAQESMLEAAVEALSRIQTGNEIVIHTEDGWLVEAVETWMKEWERRGWVTGKGEEVKQKERFKKLAGRKKTDLLRMERGLGEQYGEYLSYNVRKREKERKEEKDRRAG